MIINTVSWLVEIPWNWFWIFGSGYSKYGNLKHRRIDWSIVKVNCASRVSVLRMFYENIVMFFFASYRFIEHWKLFSDGKFVVHWREGYFCDASHALPVPCAKHCNHCEWNVTLKVYKAASLVLIINHTQDCYILLIKHIILVIS